MKKFNSVKMLVMVLVTLLFVTNNSYSANGANPGNDCGNGKDVGNHYGNSDKNCNKARYDANPNDIEAKQIVESVTPPTPLPPAPVPILASTKGSVPKFLGSFPTPYSNVSPMAVAVDSKGNIYVLFNGAVKKIIKFDSNGKFLIEFSTTFNGSTVLIYPIDIAINTLYDEIYIAEQGKNNIVVYNEFGSVLRTFGNYGNITWGPSTPGSKTLPFLFGPQAITTDNEFIYVVDSGRERDTNCGTARIIKFTRTGEYVTEFIKGKFDALWLDKVEGFWNITIDANKVMYCLSQLYIYKILPNGELISRKRHADDGTGSPFGLVIDKDNDIFMVDRYIGRVLMYNDELEKTNSFGSYGIGDNQFRVPFRACVDQYNYLYICDSNKRICKYGK